MRPTPAAAAIASVYGIAKSHLCAAYWPFYSEGRFRGTSLEWHVFN